MTIAATSAALALALLGAGSPQEASKSLKSGKKAEQVVGLTADGELEAVRVMVVSRGEEGVDRYALIRVRNRKTGKVVAEFRASDIHRTTFDGRRAFAAPDELVAGHVRWQAARSAQAWKKYWHNASFTAPPRAAQSAASAE